MSNSLKDYIRTLTFKSIIGFISSVFTIFTIVSLADYAYKVQANREAYQVKKQIITNLISDKVQSLNISLVAGNLQNIESILNYIQKFFRLDYIALNGIAHGDKKKCNIVESYDFQNRYIREYNNFTIEFCLDNIDVRPPLIFYAVLFLLILLFTSIFVGWSTISHQRQNEEKINYFVRDVVHQSQPGYQNIRRMYQKLKESNLPLGVQKTIINENERHIKAYNSILLTFKGYELPKTISKVFLNDVLKDLVGVSSGLFDGISFDFISNKLSAFAMVDESDFRGVIETLIQNSVRACGDETTPHIQIALAEDKNTYTICIRDNGHGFPKHILKSPFKGNSWGKPGGNGLGLRSSNSKVLSWGGAMSVSNTDGGALVKISLPKAPPPKWFTDTIHLNEGDEIVILDNDEVVVDDLLEIFKPHSKRIHVRAFSSVEEFSTFAMNANRNTMTFLIDQYITTSHRNTVLGLDLIEKLGIASKSILITSADSDYKLQEAADKLGAKILPKSIYFDVKLDIS